MGIRNRYFSQDKKSHDELIDLNSGVYRDGGHRYLVPLVTGTESNIKLGSVKVTATSAEMYLGGGNWLEIGGDDPNPNFDSLTVNGITNLNGEAFCNDGLQVGTPSAHRTSGFFGDTVVTPLLGVDGSFVVDGTSIIDGTSIVTGNSEVQSTLTVLGDSDLRGNTTVGTSSSSANIFAFGNIGCTGVIASETQVLVGSSYPSFLRPQDIYTEGRMIVGDFVSGTGELWVDGKSFLTLPSGTGATVVVTTDGSLAYLSSSEKVKDNIKVIPLEESKKLLNLESKRYEKSGEVEDGHIAEEVEKLFPHMACKNEKGETISYRHQDLIPHLLNLIKDLYSRLP